jgi:uncharacterized protein YjdB
MESTMTIRKLAVAAAMVFAALTGSACNDGITVPEIQAARVSLQPETSTILAVDRTVRLTPTAEDAQGRTLGTTQLAWTTSDPSVAVVDPGGNVTARGEGDAVITASYLDLASASAVIHVRATLVFNARITGLTNPLAPAAVDAVSTSILVHAKKPPQ